MTPDHTASHRISPRRGTVRPSLPNGGDRAAGSPVDLLRDAGAEVTGVWGPLLEESIPRAETESAVQWLVTAIERASRGGDHGPSDGPIVLTRFMLERVASVVLRRLGEDPTMDKSDVLVMMHGIDAVRQSIEPEWDRYFASQISGPDGLNLVLEVAHDLRSPLTSIRCLAETLERGQSGPVTELQRRQLRLIYSASLGLGTMATDVIEMARRGDQLVDDEPVPFSVGELLEGVASLVRPIAEEKGLVFQHGTLPTDQRVGPPLALSRVLLNLVTNALKFTDEGRVEVALRATALDRVEFSVSDTGRGIPESAVADLFRPFRRSTARGRSGYLFSGTGLGLALCRKLLRALGSELRYETEVGAGTRFFFELRLPPVSRL